MATILMPYSSPNQGVWTSTDDFLAAVSSVDGSFVSSSESTGQFFLALGDVTTIEPINSVTVRVVARLTTAGTRDIVAGIHNGAISYHPTIINLNSTEWDTYEWVWTTSPWTGLPFTPAEVNTMGRAYVRTAITGGTTNAEVDYVEVEVDYGGSGSTVNADLADTAAATDSITATLTQGAYTLNVNVADTATVYDTLTGQSMDIVDTHEESANVSDVVEATLISGFVPKLPGVTAVYLGGAPVRMYLGETRVW